MILVPVKNLANAKQRLAPVLEQPSRTELAQAMLADVLQALAESAADEVSLVTSDPFAIQLADHCSRKGTRLLSGLRPCIRHRRRLGED